MGNQCCPGQLGEPSAVVNDKRKNHLNLNHETKGREMSQKMFDDIEVAKMKKELYENPEIFVLNNLLLSVLFFDDFEKEKNRLKHSSRTTLERELNPSLLRNETIQSIIPDVIFENVNKNVCFVRLHGKNKHKSEPLLPRRMYIVNDKVEVIESKNTPQYSEIDKPNYQVVIEQSEDNEKKLKHGFVKLKCTTNQSQSTSEKSPNPEPKEPQPGPSSKSDDDNEIYEYSTIAKMNTPQPLEIIHCEKSDTLPKSCFTKCKIKKLDNKINNDDDEDNFVPPEEITELFEEITYISSKGFMDYFQNAVFPNSLGRTLGFDESEISCAKAIPGKIFCKECEIIPSIAIPWPDYCTFEFPNRAERPIMWDGFGREYIWPTPNMITEIRSLSCVLVPKGFQPKRGENPEIDLEWEINFPKAQRYLDTHMSHTQLRAFIFLLILFKMYIEPANPNYDGLLVDHIRNFMYWECETNPRDWPEHRLGSKMAVIIKNFTRALSVRKLPDFFMDRKNMFLNVPNKHLTAAQRAFQNVLESPALYFLGALRNLKYKDPKFYPMLDFNELYSILTATSNQLINPRAFEVIPPNRIRRTRRVKVEGDANYKKEIIWKMKQEQINRDKIMKNNEENEQKKKNLENERRGSVDSINYEWEFEKNFHNLKIRALLSFFIKHFIEIGKRSQPLLNQQQALFYFKQATYLTRILEESGLQADAEDFRTTITNAEDNSKRKSIVETFDHPPSTPIRTSVQFNFGLTQQVKDNKINLNNLNKSYNSSAIPNNLAKVKKQNSNLKTRPRSSEARKGNVGFSDKVEIR